MISFLRRLKEIFRPAGERKYFSDAEYERRWREKVLGVKQDEIFIAAVAAQLPPEFGEYLRNNFPLSGHPPRLNLSRLISFVDGQIESATALYIRDGLSEDEYRYRQTVLPVLFARLREIDENSLAANQSSTDAGTAHRLGPQAIKNAIQEETICPLCFLQFPVNSISADFGSCPDCGSEAIVVGLESLDSFLAATSVEELDDIAERWQATEGFLPQYKALKAERIAKLRARKLAES